MKWILFEKVKPKNLQRVLVYYYSKYGSRYLKRVTVAEYVEPKKVLEEDFLSEDCDGFAEYDEEKDCYWTPTGFYENQYEAEDNYFISDKIVGWMLLPKAPEHMEVNMHSFSAPVKKGKE